MGITDGNDGQARLTGPENVKLRSSTVQTLALGLHELATNALKYGALSRPEGRLSISWSVQRTADEELRLEVEWRESGVLVQRGPDEKPARMGYGRELIERALPYQLKAETTYVITPEGVHCTIALPISTAQEGVLYD
jgi:two-component sensor histidine kinase